jgi:hypothetical protein
MGDSGSQLLGMVKAKAQSFADGATGAAKRASNSQASRRRSSSCKAHSSDVPEVGTGVKEEAIQQLSDMGVSPAAARLALGKNRGRVALACNWVFDEQNRDEIEAAEAAEIETTMQWYFARARSATEQSSTTDDGEQASSESSGAEDEKKPLASGTQEGSVLVEPNGVYSWSSNKRHSLLSDNGCGIGRFLRDDIPSPRQLPVPGRLSRGSLDSRLSLGSMDSRASMESAGSDGGVESPVNASKAEFKDEVTEPDCEASCDRTLLLCDGEDDGAALNLMPGEAETQDAPDILGQESSEREPVGLQAGEEGADTNSEDDVDLQEGDLEKQEFLPPAPPDSACWDWPLSRHEKKSRVHMLERQIHAMDRKSLLQEIVKVRGQHRKSRASNSSRLSA